MSIPFQFTMDAPIEVVWAKINDWSHDHSWVQGSQVWTRACKYAGPLPQLMMTHCAQQHSCSRCICMTSRCLRHTTQHLLVHQNEPPLTQCL